VFKDDFTRSFIQSIEETSPGYYPFLSATGRYEMDFPEDTIIFGEPAYSLEKERFESLRFYREEEAYDELVTVRYYSFLKNEGIEYGLKVQVREWGKISIMRKSLGIHKICTPLHFSMMMEKMDMWR
jgi:hypothetical protein